MNNNILINSEKISSLSGLNPATTVDLENIIKKFKIKKIIEIGAFVGLGSTQIFLKHCDEITVIDDFSDEIKYKINFSNINNLKKISQLELFNLNTKSSKINLIKMNSEKAHSMLKDNYYDAVFIDGSHLYKDVFYDIINYYPKVKKNGLIIGDDCQGPLRKFNKKFIISNLNKNFCSIEKFRYSEIHPGVIMAVSDLLKGGVKFNNECIIEKNKNLGYSWIWYFKKTKINNFIFKVNNFFLKIKISVKNNFRKSYLLKNNEK
jgi:predicted O-methyltransferase YrrM